MTVALLSIGTELTRGELLNTNVTWLAERLIELGHEVTEMVTVDDDDVRIVRALLELSARHEALVCTGGLGPTTDDRTTACVARALGVPLERDARSLARIEALFRSRGYEPSESNKKQADFPRGAVVLDNDHGTAPGFSVDFPSARAGGNPARAEDGTTAAPDPARALERGCRAFFTPGVPSEMRPMFERSIVPLLPRPPGRVVVRRLRTYGTPESQVNDSLAGLEERWGITLGYRASHAEIEVKILARARPEETPEALEARVAVVEREVRERLGPSVYAEGTTSLAEAVGRLLLERGARLAVAESCTGGLLSELVTQIAGSSRYYLGGVCSYANTAKIELLGVEAESLARHGAVSDPVAAQMADGARRVFHADYALSTTGIAGPDGGSEDKPVGLVHFGLATPGGTRAWSSVFRGDRAQIQRRAALRALWELHQELAHAAH